jgi:hypothetical protein
MRDSSPVDALPPAALREIAVRERRAVESWRTAAQAIGPITPGCAVLALTRGQWGMIDGILHVLDQVGPSDLYLWTWTIAHYEVDSLARLMADRRVRSARLILDTYAMQRTPSSELVARRWVQQFGAESVRALANHAKIARVGSVDGVHKVVMRGSCNLNRSPRMEQIDVSEGGPAWEMLAGVEAALPPMPLGSTFGAARDACGMNAAHDPEFLRLFNEAKEWQP